MLTTLTIYFLSKNRHRVMAWIKWFLFQIACVGLFVLFFIFKIFLWTEFKAFGLVDFFARLLFLWGQNSKDKPKDILVEFTPTSLDKKDDGDSRLIHKKNEYLPGKSVVIIGGGYAGTSVAMDLEWDFKVTLIDEKEYFEFTPSRLRTITDPSHVFKIRMNHETYLPKTTVVHDWVHQITPTHVVTSHHRIEFDYLIVCTGARSHETQLPSVEGPKSQESNVRIISARAQNFEQYHHHLKSAESVLVIGGGTVGVELAAEIIEAFPKKMVTIVHSGSALMHRSPAKASAFAEKWLRDRGVQLVLTDRIKEQNGRSFHTCQGVVIEADLAFICTGNVPNSECLKKKLLDPTDFTPEGFVLTNPHLQLVNYPNIFVGGDLTFIPGEDEKLCQTAGAAAKVIAKNVRNMAKGKPLRSYKSGTYPMLVSLGRYDGIFIFSWFSFTGFIPAVMKEFVEFKEMVFYWDWKRFQLWKKKKLVTSPITPC